VSAIIQVLIDSGVSKIPMAHILKRWTREARDFGYQDIGAGTNDASVTDEHRHSLLHVNALEVVGRAKNDRQIHDIVARHLKSAMTEIEHLVDWRSNQPGYCSPTGNGSDSASDAEAVNGNSYGAAGISARMSDAEIENMRAPAVHLPQGRPICNKKPSALDKIRKGTKEKGSQSESLSVCERCQEEGHTVKSCKLRPKTQEKKAKSALNGKKRRLY
jgi:hypothetical protein